RRFAWMHAATKVAQMANRRSRSCCATTVCGLFGSAVVVIRMCDARCVGETLRDAAAIVEAIAACPGYALSDDELTAEVVDAYALVSMATALAAARAHEAAGRDLPRRRDCASAVRWLVQTLRVAASEARR